MAVIFKNNVLGYVKGEIPVQRKKVEVARLRQTKRRQVDHSGS